MWQCDTLKHFSLKSKEGFFPQRLQTLTGKLDYSPYSCSLILAQNGGFLPYHSYIGPFPVYNEGSAVTDFSGLKSSGPADSFWSLLDS